MTNLKEVVVKIFSSRIFISPYNFLNMFDCMINDEGFWDCVPGETAMRVRNLSKLRNRLRRIDVPWFNGKNVEN